MENLPDDIRAALLRSAKQLLLTKYIGGRRKLEAWSEFNASLTGIRSYSLPGDRGKSLRRLAKLAANGHLVERPRYKKGVGTRTFTLPQAWLDEIGQQAQREWEALGYVVGQMMDPIPEPDTCNPSN
ncbi:hypothetical protein HNP46_002160 [Pseudomonas nitritireducens]|uniref:Uncharacterized protein n=1 Tax=Pseudomonas nitroreducens TaxID=46680 RepID=A0A7W7KJM7_PSENT|nr:hypothetical protein [Pseudomonas nitritireducens]MBB4863313.1 hypothetical protein [Pseudomonas nitritireducens]